MRILCICLLKHPSGNARPLRKLRKVLLLRLRSWTTARFPNMLLKTFWMAKEFFSKTRLAHSLSKLNSSVLANELSFRKPQRLIYEST